MVRRGKWKKEKEAGGEEREEEGEEEEKAEEDGPVRWLSGNRSLSLILKI